MNKQDENLWRYYQKDDIEVFSTTHDRHEKVYFMVKRYIEPGSKILEIGFGDGHLLKKMSKEYDCYGADISKEIIDEMRKNVMHIKLDHIDVDGKLPYENGYFDGFVASEVLEHMSNEELNVCIDEIGRILKRGGYAIITVPVEENLKDSECFCPNCGQIFHKWGHKQYWNKAIIKEKFKNKFDIIQIKKISVNSSGLNIFGKIELIIRKIISAFGGKIKGETFMVIIKNK